MPHQVERFTVGCPKCGKRYVLTQAAVGKTAKCKCGCSFVVQVPPEDLEDEDAGGTYDVTSG